jgi:hypothetical protein
LYLRQEEKERAHSRPAEDKATAAELAVSRAKSPKKRSHENCDLGSTTSGKQPRWQPEMEPIDATQVAVMVVSENPSAAPFSNKIHDNAKSDTSSNDEK